ncbi:MAG: helix-turn-helix domain-containing protein [Mangrovibacterium sp.]|nr:helix-turn-helix domain-containing protein [Mangrovibacterium sp.]
MKAMNPYAFPGFLLLPREIENVAASVWNVPVESLYQKTRQREVAEARYSVFHYRKTKMNEQEPDIAKTVPFDRTTVIHAIKAVEHLLEFDRPFQRKYRLFQDALANDLVSSYKVHR